MTEYTLAIIIPCWNCGEHLEELIDSILAQDFTDYKVFCIDDHSTDNTSSILNKYTESNSQINYLIRNRTPKGAQTCRNIGFDLSEGAKYVIWLDSDDVIAPYCFRQRVDFMEHNMDLDFGVFPAKSFENNILDKNKPILFGFAYPPIDDLKRILRRTLPFVGWTNIYRRTAVVRTQLSWDEKILSLQDSDFNIQAVIKGLRYGYAENSKIDYFWRMKKYGISKKIFTDEHKKSHIYLLNKIHVSLSLKQKKKYRLELDDFLFFFLEKFYYDHTFVKSVLKPDWHEGRIWFCIRIMLYYFVFKKRGKRLGKRFLFPKLYKYRIEDDKKYWNYHNNLLSEQMKLICKNVSID